MYQNNYTHSLIGTPQGGIVSPLLFNISMFFLDKFICNDIKERMKHNSNKKPKSLKEYVKIRRLIEKQRRQLVLLTKGTKAYRQLEKEIQKNIQQRNNIPYANPTEKDKSGVYVRYIDDWLSIFTGNKKDAKQAKEKINTYIQNELKLELDLDKTKITKLKSMSFRYVIMMIKHGNTPKTSKTGVSQRFNSRRLGYYGNIE